MSSMPMRIRFILVPEVRPILIMCVPSLHSDQRGIKALFYGLTRGQSPCADETKKYIINK